MKIDEQIVKKLMHEVWKRGFLVGFITASIISAIIEILIITTTK